jgi:hypothetical protein
MYSKLGLSLGALGHSLVKNADKIQKSGWKQYIEEKKGGGTKLVFSPKLVLTQASPPVLGFALLTFTFNDVHIIQ